MPILGSIPLIGGLFRSNSKSNLRTELLVLITPYVLMTPEEARAETERLHAASNVSAEDWYRGWSDSSLAPFSPADLKAQRDAKNAAAAKRRQEQWRAAAEQLGAKVERPTLDLDSEVEPIVEPPTAPEAAPAAESDPAPVLILSPDDPDSDVPLADPDQSDPQQFSRAVETMMETPAPPLATDDPDATAPFAIDPAALTLSMMPQRHLPGTRLPHALRAVVRVRPSSPRRRARRTARHSTRRCSPRRRSMTEHF